MNDWTFKKPNVPTKWCWKCLEWSREKEKNIREKEEVKEEEQEKHNIQWDGVPVTPAENCRKEYEGYCIREGIGFVKQDAQYARHYEVRMRSVRCPDCNKEMQVRSLKKHQAHHCKAVVAAV